MVKVSIITVCYNSKRTIRDTINSIAMQKHSSVEHVVIDGGSDDGTLDIIKSAPTVSHYVSEPDQGIYDAMNKGIKLASGDVVGTLNADDFYFDSNVLDEVAKIFSDPKVDACYGDLVYVAQSDANNIVRFWKSNEYKLGLFETGWMPAHPTVFIRKGVYEKLGGFNLDYKIAADFELLFRYIEQNKINTKYIPKIMVKMRLGGTTNKSVANVVKQNKEIVTILRRQYPKLSLVKFILIKTLNRLMQFITRPNFK